MTALGQGDLLTELRMNGFAVIVVVPVFVGLAHNALDAFGVRLPAPPRVHPTLIRAFGFAVLVFWIARNLPCARAAGVPEFARDSSRARMVSPGAGMFIVSGHTKEAAICS